MVRIHVVIWRTDDALKDAEEEGLERAVENIVRTWSDELCDRILKHYGSAGYRLVDKYLSAFPAGYRDTNQPGRALQDICGLEKLGPDLKTEIDIHKEDPRDGDKVRATLLQVDRPVTLSARVPIFENMGFDVISERTFELTPKLDGDAGLVYLHDTDLRLTNGGRAELFARRQNLEKGFLAIWSGAAANDRYNGLILGAGLDWRQAALLRAYGAYYRQTGAPYGTIMSRRCSISMRAPRRTCSSCSTGCSIRPTAWMRTPAMPNAPRSSSVSWRRSIRSRCSTRIASCATCSR